MAYPRRMSKPGLHPPPAPPSTTGSSDLGLSDLGDTSFDGDTAAADLGAGDGLLLEIDPTFMREPASDVRIACGRNTFWVHAAFLRFSSDWFRTILEGDWAESQPVSDVDSFAVNVPPGRQDASSVVATEDGDEGAQDRRSNADSQIASEISNLDLNDPLSPLAAPSNPRSPPSPTAPHASATPWETAWSTERRTVQERKDSQETSRQVRVRRAPGRQYITISLPADEARPLHDYLQHVYPHLTLHITWLNVEPLIHFASKYQIPSLTPLLTAFLFAHAPGRPLSALSLASLLSLPSLYTEASRYVLDLLPSWPQDEYRRLLGSETRWKLERRRGWFLDRVLKMGLVEVEKDYICHAACPHPQRCAKELDDKFRTAYTTSFRFGAPQPSVVYRNLRCPASPPQGFILPLTLCNETAKTWLENLFDRMFEIPLSTTAEGSKGRFFLTIKMEDD